VVGSGELLASGTVAPFAGTPGLRPARCNGFIGEFSVKVAKRDMSAILAKPMDVTPSMPAEVLLIPDDGVEPPIGIGFGITGVGFVMTGVGLVMTGIGFGMTGIGFIIPPMPDIPDAIDSRSLRSSDSTEIDAFRRVLRAKNFRRSCSSCDLIGLTLGERCVKTREHT
jgi:hypothetical protein